MQSVLQNFADRFSGVSSNRVRLEVQGAKSGLGPGTTVSFTLPSATIINLKTIALNGKFKCTGTGSPKLGSLASLFERVEVAIGGQCISPGNYWGVAHSIHQAHSGCRGSLLGDHPILAQEGAVGYMRDHTCATTKEEFSFQFSDWSHGFLAASPSYFNTSLCGHVTVRITLAPLSVISGTTVTSYRLDDVFVDFETLSIANESYASMQSAVMSQTGYLPVPFKENYVIRTAHTGVSRASVSSRSLDRFITAIRPSANDKVATAITVPANGLGAGGKNQIEMKKSPATTFGPITASGTDLYSGDVKAFYSFGGSRFPQQEAEYESVIQKISEDALYEDEKLYRFEKLTGKSRKANEVFAARLNLAGSSSPVIASGIDSRGQSLIVEYNTSGGTTVMPPDGTAIAWLVAECTSLVMIAPDRSVSLAR